MEAELARLQQQLTFARAGERQQMQAQAAMKAEQRALQQQLEVRRNQCVGLSASETSWSMLCFSSG